LRVLFSTSAYLAHFHPLVPLARSAEAAGHEVAFASPVSFAGQVRAAGFMVVGSGIDYDVDPQLREIRNRIDATEPGLRRLKLFVIDELVDTTTRLRVSELIEACKTWGPDMVVREQFEFASVIAAEYLELLHVSVTTVGSPLLDAWPKAVEEVKSRLGRIRASWGLPPDPDLEMLYRYLCLSFVPPSFHDAMLPLPRTLHALRTVAFDRSGHESLPEWVTRGVNRPLVYVTLGTMSNKTPGVLETIVAALQEFRGTVIVTVGRDRRPSDFGPQPPHIHIEKYIPNSQLLPYCDLVVTHGGQHTVLGCLSFGLPLVTIPLEYDQPYNSERCLKMGVGQVISPEKFSSGAVSEAVHSVLADSQYRENAEKIRTEVLSLPGPDYGVRLLEILHTERRPLIARGRTYYS
jgi:MGT family glycosyltransferase